MLSSGGIPVGAEPFEARRIPRASPPGRPARAAMPAPAPDTIVHLNVGGVGYSTSVLTLCGLEPRSMLAVLASGSSALESQRDEHGRLFIDRDGSRFRLVLNYLRSGAIYCQDDPQTLRELQEEADFFGLDGLKRLVESELSRIELEEDMEERRAAPYSQQSDLSYGNESLPPEDTNPLLFDESSLGSTVSHVSTASGISSVRSSGGAEVEKAGTARDAEHEYEFRLDMDF